MSDTFKTMLAACAGAMIAGGAMAADVAPAPAAPPTPLWDIAFGMKLANDYVFRGIDQSNGHFAAQGYVEGRAFDWIYAGVWTSNVSFPQAYGLLDPSAEVDIYGGIRHTWGNFTADAGVLYYVYPNQINQPGLYGMDWAEAYFKPSYVINDTFTVGLNGTYGWNYANTGADSGYVSGTLKANLPPMLPWKDVSTYISGEFGGQFIGTTRYGYKLPSYATWNVGVGATWSAITLDLRYSGMSLSHNSCALLTGVGNWCGQRFIASLAFDTTLFTLK
ncbi:TorF family putative porin [Methylocella sp.]|uniref:TorF family putative porin n=1 Tax=Methylocella sp. TaxID=1978226 RepID=UPI0035B19548